MCKKLGCVPTSITNWEKGKVIPSLEVLSSLCEVYGISPLSLLGNGYSYPELVEISNKPIPERSYEEQVALNFSAPILVKLLQADANRREVEETEQNAKLLYGLNLLDRFGGSMTKAEIDAVRAEYTSNDSADKDILFAFHMLTTGNKSAFLSMLAGLIADPENVQDLNPNMKQAQDYTIARLREHKKDL